MKLYAYFRSSTSYRLRIALELKGLDYEVVPVDLRTSQQSEAAFTSRNPFGSVPMLEADGRDRAQSMAMLEWLEEAQLDRVGCFQYENVAGARSNALPDHVAPEIKQERWERFMEKAQAISEAKLAAKVGQRLEVIVDEVDAEAATCRTKADAPEIDGNLFIDTGFEALSVGDIVTVEVDEAGEYDLWGRLV